MNPFDKTKEGIEHKFYKHDPEILKQLFGSDDLSSFWLADMDFQIAEPISKEIKRLADRGNYAYEFNTEDVFDAIVNWYKNRHQLFLDKNSFIQVNGVLTGISLLIQELTEEGDSIIIQTPVYHQFASIVKNTNRRLVQNPLIFQNGKYEMDFEDLESKIESEDVKIIVLCNPHNPVGRVWSRKELQRLSDIATQHNVLIISDEIHSDVVYNGNKFNSILILDDKRHIALLGSPAKTFGMQSFSNGYIYIPDGETRKLIGDKAESLYLHHGNVFTNYATIAAYNHGSEWLDELTSYLQRNIQWMNGFLEKELPAIKLIQPEGTYQVWIDFRELGLTKEGLNTLLIDKAKIGLAPGHWFGRSGFGFMRMNIASPLSKIQDAFKRLNLAIKEK